MKGISMKCPKCGYYRQTRDNAFTPTTECPACGVIYAKHDHPDSMPETIGAVPPPHLKPSPVDAVSLKKARDRVEKRLRQQLKSRTRDKRHEETLRLARRFAEKEVRKRREKWEQKRHVSTSQEQPEEAETSISPTVDQSIDLAQQPLDESRDTQNAAVLEAPTIQPSDAEEIAPEETIEADDYSQTDDLEAETDAKATDYAKLVAHRKASRRSVKGMMRLLPSIAWLILCTGVIGAVLSWTTISDVEAGVNIPVPSSVGSLPLGLLLGFAYLATGALGFAFFWVSSLISHQLRDIRRLLLIRPMSLLARADTYADTASTEKESP